MSKFSLFLIDCMDSFIEGCPMFIRHVARSEEGYTGCSTFHGAAYGLFNFGGHQSMTFRILDVGFVLPVTTDEESAEDRFLSLDRFHLLFDNLCQPRGRFEVKVIVVHREEGINVPLVPFLAHHPASM